jgi:hypothetical protein
VLDDGVTVMFGFFAFGLLAVFISTVLFGFVRWMKDFLG